MCSVYYRDPVVSVWPRRSLLDGYMWRGGGHGSRKSQCVYDRSSSNRPLSHECGLPGNDCNGARIDRKYDRLCR